MPFSLCRRIANTTCDPSNTQDQKQKHFLSEFKTGSPLAACPVALGAWSVGRFPLVSARGRLPRHVQSYRGALPMAESLLLCTPGSDDLDTEQLWSGSSNP